MPIVWQGLMPRSNEAQQTDTMTWTNFKKAFKRDYLGVDVQYVKVDEYLRLRQEDMTVKEFFNKLNFLAWYTLGVASINKGKIKIFINELRVDIA